MQRHKTGIICSHCNCLTRDYHERVIDNEDKIVCNVCRFVTSDCSRPIKMYYDGKYQKLFWGTDYNCELIICADGGLPRFTVGDKIIDIPKMIKKHFQSNDVPNYRGKSGQIAFVIEQCLNKDWDIDEDDSFELTIDNDCILRGI